MFCFYFVLCLFIYFLVISTYCRLCDEGNAAMHVCLARLLGDIIIKVSHTKLVIRFARFGICLNALVDFENRPAQARQLCHFIEAHSHALSSLYHVPTF